MKESIKKFFDIKFWKFLLVGVINTAVGEGVVLLCLHLIGWKNFVWGAGAAAVAGTVIGSIVSYFLNKYFTFQNKEKGFKPMLRFTLNIVVCLLIRVIAATAVSELCKALSLSMFGMDVNSFAGNMGWAVGACVFVACNYIGQRFFAFREKKEDTDITEEK
ncbi:MAG: GtrA family protein [Ruminococcus sp.]|nr:GtrA family protein [Ruminococcus sp.]